jgi:hypothetical protein
MKFPIKFLPAIALAMALSPFAAQAAVQPAHGGYQTVVQSGGPAPMFPASTGG